MDVYKEREKKTLSASTRQRPSHPFQSFSLFSPPSLLSLSTFLFLYPFLILIIIWVNIFFVWFSLDTSRCYHPRIDRSIREFLFCFFLGFNFSELGLVCASCSWSCLSCCSSWSSGVGFRYLWYFGNYAWKWLSFLGFGY